jgi:hypothetical protein
VCYLPINNPYSVRKCKTSVQVEQLEESGIVVFKPPLIYELIVIDTIIRGKSTRLLSLVVFQLIDHSMKVVERFFNKK